MPRVHFKEQKVAPGHLALTFLISKPRPLASWDPEQVWLLLLGVGDFTVSHTVKERPDAQAGEAGLKDGLFGVRGSVHSLVKETERQEMQSGLRLYKVRTQLPDRSSESVHTACLRLRRITGNTSSKLCQVVN